MVVVRVSLGVREGLGFSFVLGPDGRSQFLNFQVQSDFIETCEFMKA